MNKTIGNIISAFIFKGLILALLSEEDKFLHINEINEQILADIYINYNHDYESLVNLIVEGENGK